MRRTTRTERALRGALSGGVRKNAEGGERRVHDASCVAMVKTAEAAHQARRHHRGERARGLVRNAGHGARSARDDECDVEWGVRVDGARTVVAVAVESTRVISTATSHHRCIPPRRGR